MLGFPLCFNSRKEYEGWKALAALSDDIPSVSNPHCWDCTPQYQAMMKRQGRCMRQEVVFVEVVFLDTEPEPELHGISADAPIGALLSGSRWIVSRG